MTKAYNKRNALQMNAIGFTMKVDRNPNWDKVMGMKLLRGVKTGDFVGQWLDTSKIGKSRKKDKWTWKLPLDERLRGLEAENKGKSPCSLDKIEVASNLELIEEIRKNLQLCALKSKAR